MILDSNSASGGYDIDNSCKFNKAGSETMYKSNTNGDRRTWTTSFWMKFCGHTGTGNDTHMLYHGVYGQGTRMFTGYDQLYIDLCGLGNERYRWITNQVFRDRSAWYHIVWRVDTTQSSLSDRMRLYVNGEQITDWQKEADDADNDSSNSGNKMPQNYDTLANYVQAGYDVLQFSYKEASIYSDMYMAEFHHCDGYSYGPTEFGKFDDNGIWIPIEADVSYGNNGCYLDFKDSSNMGNDANGGTDFTLQNISAADQATDTPTNNFCTFNPLMVSGNAPTISDGAMKVTGGGGNWNSAWGTIGVKNGKWYYEQKVTNTSYMGFLGASTTPAEGTNTSSTTALYNTSIIIAPQASATHFYYYQNGVQTSNESTGWATFGVGDILGVALDLDSSTKTIAFYKNGTLLSGSASNPANLPTNMQDEFIFPLVTQYENKQDELNFGGYTEMSISSGNTDGNGYGNFEIAPPSGYYAICSKNLAEYG